MLLSCQVEGYIVNSLGVRLLGFPCEFSFIIPSKFILKPFPNSLQLDQFTLGQILCCNIVSALLAV